ncbi:MAG: GntR family transcriptional regulator [Actinomycetota bacterium]|nr:GntR family transcriptional regulator [Actinomycetota bacterium]
MASLGPSVIAVWDCPRREITAGELAPGQRLGAEREIAERLEVSRSTVRLAAEQEVAAALDLDAGALVHEDRARDDIPVTVDVSRVVDDMRSTDTGHRRVQQRIKRVIRWR